MLKNSNLGPLLIILVFLLLAVSGYVVREKRWPGLPWSLGVAPTKFTLLLEAPKGGVVAGFPVDFLTLAKDAEIEKSAKYNVKEEVGEAVVLTTTYTTGASIAELFAGYIEYLNNNGYTVLKTNARSGHSIIEAVSAEYTVSIDISISTRTKKQVRIDVMGGVVQ
jgi:hypothetical protein